MIILLYIESLERKGFVIVKPEKPIAFQTGTNGRYGFNLKGVNIKHDKRQILRNLVNPEIGLHFLNRAMGINTERNREQFKLF